MLPLYREAGILLIVFHSLVTSHSALIVEAERAIVTVALTIIGKSAQGPRAFGIDVTSELEVHLVTDGKIVAAFAQIESSRGLVTIGRHDETAGIALGKGEEAIGNGKRQGHVGHHQISRSEHHVLSRAHLGSRHSEVEVRMRQVAGGIASVIEEHIAIGSTLRLLRGHKAILLGSVDIVNQSHLRLEVEGHRVCLIGIVAHLEHGRAVLLPRRVCRTHSMHQT